MALLGSTPTLRCSCCGTPLVGKVTHLCRAKIYLNSHANVLGELRCGHITTISSGNGWVGVSGFEKYPAVVPCATTDGESGSSLKLGSCVGQHYVLLGTKKICFENPFFQMNPCIKAWFPQIKP